MIKEIIGTPRNLKAIVRRPTTFTAVARGERKQRLSRIKNITRREPGHFGLERTVNSTRAATK